MNKIFNTGFVVRVFTRLVGVTLLTVALNGCVAMSSLSTAMSIYQMLGGSDVIGGLSNTLLNSAMTDPRLSGLLGSINPTTASPQIANQLCATLGGGCAAPFSNEQVSAGATRLSPEQKMAVSDNLGTSLNAITNNPTVRDAVIKSLSPQIGGILGALL